MYNRLVLGTAQLGSSYGRTNQRGLMNLEESTELLNYAFENGIASFDTAQAYGNSEQKIGFFIKQLTAAPKLPEIITKLYLDPQFVTQASNKDLVRRVELQVQQSLDNLNLNSLDCLLLHRVEYLTIRQGLVWSKLLELHHAGSIKKLGVSINTPADLQTIISIDCIRHIQLPFNILDWRWNSVFDLIASKKDITYHVRSVYLQGILLQQHADKWPNINCTNSIIAKLKQVASKLELNSVKELCLAFINSHDWIDGIVIGAETIEQVASNLSSINAKKLGPEELHHVYDSFCDVPLQLLSPSEWP